MEAGGLITSDHGGRARVAQAVGGVGVVRPNQIESPHEADERGQGEAMKRGKEGIMSSKKQKWGNQGGEPAERRGAGIAK